MIANGSIDENSPVTLRVTAPFDKGAFSVRKPFPFIELRRFLMHWRKVSRIFTSLCQKLCMISS